MPYDETLAVARGIGRGLGDAHRANIVHRDLKPTNVFIAKVGSSRSVKLVEFGVAKIVSSAHRITQRGVILGSPSYMSPEQAKASHIIDHKSDLWSFGVLLYRCLSGRKPFEGTVNEILQKICNKTPPLFSSMERSGADTHMDLAPPDDDARVLLAIRLQPDTAAAAPMVFVARASERRALALPSASVVEEPSPKAFTEPALSIPPMFEMRRSALTRPPTLTQTITRAPVLPREIRMRAALADGGS